jgi:hypothetical protein
MGVLVKIKVSLVSELFCSNPRHLDFEQHSHVLARFLLSQELQKVRNLCFFLSWGSDCRAKARGQQKLNKSLNIGAPGEEKKEQKHGSVGPNQGIGASRKTIVKQGTP